MFPGGALVGCDAGYLNAARIKGSHAAIKSGMLCAAAFDDALAAGRALDELSAYPAAFEASWLNEELQRSRNFKLWFKKGKLDRQPDDRHRAMAAAQARASSARRGRCTRRSADHECLLPASQCTKIDYPKPDGKLTFDRLSSVFISNTNHAEDQPSHLTLKDASLPVAVNLKIYAGPECALLPGRRLRVRADDDGGERLQINAQNCVHCKTCDIKDPRQNIVWVTPEGGGGPNYAGM